MGVCGCVGVFLLLIPITPAKLIPFKRKVGLLLRAILTHSIIDHKLSQSKASSHNY